MDRHRAYQRRLAAFVEKRRSHFRTFEFSDRDDFTDISGVFNC
jgi:hypothetical protein